MKKAIYTIAALSLSLIYTNSSWGSWYDPCPGQECEAGYVETTWIDTLTDDFKVSKDGYYSYQHDITDEGFTLGVDTITKAFLYIEFSFDDRTEKAKIDLPGWSDDKTLSFSFDDEIEITLGSCNEDYLETNGFLDVTISYKGCSCDELFYVTKSKLTVDGCEPIPEPATMLLLGAGIAGLAGISRRRKQ